MSLIELGTNGNGSKSLPLSVGLWFDNEELNEFSSRHLTLSTSTIPVRPIILKTKLPNSKFIIGYSSARNGWGVHAVAWSALTCPFLPGKIGCINWGLVAGKTDTVYQWKELEALEPVSFR